MDQDSVSFSDMEVGIVGTDMGIMGMVMDTIIKFIRRGFLIYYERFKKIQKEDVMEVARVTDFS